MPDHSSQHSNTKGGRIFRQPSRQPHSQADDDESIFRHFDRQQLKLYYQVLDSVGGNHAKAALVLGVERTALYKHVKRLEKRLSAER